MKKIDIWEVLKILVLILFILLGIYIGGWLMFIKPILTVCTAIDTGTLTAIIVGKAIIKCFFAAPVGVGVVLLIIDILFIADNY